MERISLIAVDLDGTLLTSAGQVAPEGGRALTEAARAGVRVVLATTRNPDTVRNICRRLALHDPMICTNGAQVWGSPDGPVWLCDTIPRAVALQIALLADQHGWELSTTIGDTAYWRQRSGQPLGYLKPDVVIVPTNAAAIVDDPVRIIVNEPAAIVAIRDLCQTTLAGRCHAETYYEPDGALHSLCIFAPGTSKGRALALVEARLNIPPEEVMVIGDNPNDLTMFPHARLRVAVGNALAAVKRQATAIAPSNDEEGVAWAVRRLVLCQT